MIKVARINCASIRTMRRINAPIICAVILIREY